METKFLVYKNNIDNSSAHCSSDSKLLNYLDLLIQKFNHKYNKKIGFYGQEIISGEHLVIAKTIVENELIDLIDNYHIDADPNGFGRSAMKVEILGKERILNHFGSNIDKIIFSLNRLLIFLEDTVNMKGHVEIYGLGDIDVLDCHLVWEAKKILKEKNKCSKIDLKKEIEYIFHVDELIKRNPNIFSERLMKLEKKGYLTINNENINLTEKGKVVNIWTNFIVKSVTIEKEQLKTFANTSNRCTSHKKL